MNGKQRTIVLPSSNITHLNFIVASVSEFAVECTKVWLEKGGWGCNRYFIKRTPETQESL